MPMRHLGRSAIGAARGLVLLFALLEPYRRARLTSFLDPWAARRPTRASSPCRARSRSARAGSPGVGLGESVQKVFYLPEAHTDFILAIIGEELGVLGIAVLLFLYGLVAYAGLRVAQRAQGAYAKLLAAGDHVADPLPGACSTSSPCSASRR